MTLTLAAVTAIVLAGSWLTFLSGTVIPLITGIVTKQVASSGVKAVCTAVLSVVGGIFTAALQNNGTIYLEPSIGAIGVCFLTAIGMYYGFLKPTGISGSVQAKTANVGIG